MANFFRSVLLRLQNKTVTAGTSASSFTKDSGYDGLGTVTVNPTPSETKTQAAGTSNIDVTPSSGKLLSKVTVTPTPTETKSATPSTTAQTITPSSGKHLSSVSISAISTETKSQAAGTSNIDVTPTSGKYLTKVTITPQQHSGSFTPTANLKGASGNANDMGATHNNRYIDTSGMIVPSGNKAISANGTGIDVASYSTVSVSVPHPTHTTTYTPAANKSNNDMGATHSYRYVNTSGMIVPSGTKDNSSSPYTSNGTYTVTGLDSYTGVKLAVNVPSPTITSITPSNSAVFFLDPTKTYKVTAAGQCIKESTTVSSSNSNPPYLQPPDEGDGLYYVGPGGSGYLIESYDTITPTDSPVTVSDGGIYKMDGEGSVIKGSIPILSLSSVPTSFQANKAYRTVEAGYAIRSYQNNITPSASGASFDKGMVKMTEAGYAYSAKPSETTLYTNSSPTKGISNGTILNLSQSMSNFTHLKFYWRYSITNEGTISSIMIAVPDMKNCTDAAYAPRLVLGGWNVTAGMNFARCIKYNSDTSVYCYNGVRCWGSGTMEGNPGWIIPTKITGLKMHAIS